MKWMRDKWNKKFDLFSLASNIATDIDCCSFKKNLRRNFLSQWQNEEAAYYMYINNLLKDM